MGGGALRDDAVAEKESTGNAVASEQLKRKKKEKRQVLRENIFKKWTRKFGKKDGGTERRTHLSQQAAKVLPS